MRPLFHCQACGFVSTFGFAFKRVDGVLLDSSCVEAYRKGEEPVTKWVKQAKVA